MPSLEEIRQSILDQVQAKLEENGWTAIAVDYNPEKGHPPFAYSVGFEQTFRTPEVVMAGFEAAMMQMVIGEMAAAMKERYIKMPEAGGRVRGVIPNFDVLLRPVPEAAVFPLSKIAQAFREPQTARLLQLVLPDAKGLFPGDPGSDPQYVQFQDLSPFAAQ